MSFSTSRLRSAELLGAVCGVVVVVVLLASHWYARGGTGWQSLSVLRWLVLLAAAAAIGTAVLAATQRTPALAIAAAVLTSLVGPAAAIGLIIRVLVHPPGGQDLSDVQLGGFLGLAAGLGIAAAAWLALRDERPGSAGLRSDGDGQRAPVRRPAPAPGPETGSGGPPSPP